MIENNDYDRNKKNIEVEEVYTMDKDFNKKKKIRTVKGVVIAIRKVLSQIIHYIFSIFLSIVPQILFYLILLPLFDRGGWDSNRKIGSEAPSYSVHFPDEQNDKLTREEWLDNNFFFSDSVKIEINNWLYSKEAISNFRNNEFKPSNIIFYGEPATYKTFSAESIAKRESCCYFKVSGGSFERVYVGAGASKLEKMIRDAKRLERRYSKKAKGKPFYIIIDEIDSLAKRKSFNLNGDNTLVNTWLTEVDKIEKEKVNIVIIGTTNVIDLMEEASVREGRASKIRFTKDDSPKTFRRIFDASINNFFVDTNAYIFDENDGKIMSRISSNDMISNKEIALSTQFLDKFFQKMKSSRVEENNGNGGSLSFPQVNNEINKVFFNKYNKEKNKKGIENPEILKFCLSNDEDLLS